MINIGVGIRVYNGAPLADVIRQKNPTCTDDNFLKPVHFTPETLSLDEVKVITKRMALTRPNYFMYDEDETTPPLILMLGTTLLRFFAPKQPLWRLHILIRQVQRYMGISWLKKQSYEKLLCKQRKG